MSHTRADWDLSTKLNHPESIKILNGNRPLLQPIYHSVKFVPSEDYPYWDQFIYGRVANPTTQQLEKSLADIQGRDECVVFASGIAALTGSFLALLKAGDHMITFRELYRPARIFISDILPRYNITNTILKLKNVAELEASIIEGKTKLIHFESPTNPNLEIADINLIIKIARKHGLIVSMDGTFAGLHQHTQFDVDIMIHSLTKFANGHGDVLAGAVAGKKDYIKLIRESSVFWGATLDPQAANLVSRGLKTYLLRFERQTQTAQALAHFLKAHPKIKIVRYPGLNPEEAMSKLAKSQMSDMGAIVSFEIDESLGITAEKFCHRLKLIQFAASLGATESIICPSLTFFGQDLTLADREEMGINAFSLRLSVGLESEKDLLIDLNYALNEANFPK